MPASILPREGLTLEALFTPVRLLALQPLVTGLGLYSLLHHRQQLQALLPPSIYRTVTTPGFINWLKVLLGLGILRKANNYLSQLVLNNFTSDTWKLGEEIVLITGGSSGMGELLVHKLAKSSAKVIILDLVPSQKPLPSNAFLYIANISDSKQVSNVAAKIREVHGSPTVLINNAGIDMYATIFDETEEQIRRTFDVNIIAHFIMVKEFLPAMIKKNHGHVVTISSMASYVTYAQHVDYSCTKAAALVFHEGLAAELKARYGANKIRTTVVHPTFVRTPMTAHWVTDPRFNSLTLEPETVVDALVKQLLSGKSGQLFLPGRMGMVSGIRGLPSWVQELMRNSGGQVLICASGAHKEPM